MQPGGPSGSAFIKSYSQISAPKIVWFSGPSWLKSLVLNSLLLHCLTQDHDESKILCCLWFWIAIFLTAENNTKSQTKWILVWTLLFSVSKKKTRRTIRSIWLGKFVKPLFEWSVWTVAVEHPFIRCTVELARIVLCFPFSDKNRR